ncbi:retrovirus-related pol polyprotein from transposon TNT 1-94, partial [Tanacetum coccineum]
MLGSLVTYKWISHQFAKDIINDPFIPYIKMKDAIRQKFMIDDYRQALLESNPGSTYRLYVEDTSAGKSYFKRFYVCFKGMKDGWLEGCRRVIGLDGCFLKHICRGELLTTMGMDANNQMYPIAWAVVRVENTDNWCWFLALLHDDLKLQQGTGLTLISDGHKVYIKLLEIGYQMQSTRNAPDIYMPTSKRSLVTVFLSACQELEVRCGDSVFGVNLAEKRCACRLWKLSGIPCIHTVAGYMHLNRDPDEG